MLGNGDVENRFTIGTYAQLQRLCTLASVGMETRQYPASLGAFCGLGNSGIKRCTG